MKKAEAENKPVNLERLMDEAIRQINVGFPGSIIAGNPKTEIIKTLITVAGELHLLRKEL